MSSKFLNSLSPLKLITVKLDTRNTSVDGTTAIRAPLLLGLLVAERLALGHNKVAARLCTPFVKSSLGFKSKQEFQEWN